MEELDKIAKAEKRIQMNLFDVEPWTILIRDSQIKKIDEARNFYEKLVDQFPNCGRFWKIYIEHEMKARNYEKVEKLFQRCLMKILHIDLWKLYLTYIKETKVGLTTYREKMVQAYDFALEKIGIDVNSYQIWADYINFLKSVEAIGSFAENQRIMVVRKIFQRAIINPMYNVETAWRDYCIFESSINPLISKKMQEEKTKEHQNVKRVVKEYEHVTKGLNKNVPSIPPQNIAEDLKQVELWRKYISWEKSNPLQTEDQLVLTKRVIFAYEQCLLCLGYHPDVWLEAASYLEKASKILIERGVDAPGKMYADDASALYERATSTFLKDSLLIYLAYADFEETRMKYEKVHSIYKRALDLPNIDPTLIYIQYMKFARRAEGIKIARTIFKMAREDTRSKYHIYIAAALMEHYCSKESAVALRIFELAFKKYGDEIDFIKEYLAYTSQLNEDNNTRVLFERVLSSGQIPKKKKVPTATLR